MIQEDLFGYLRDRTGVEYLSDIRYSLAREEAIRLALEIEGNAYPIRVWRDLAQYLAIAPMEESLSVEEIKRRLACALAEHKKGSFPPRTQNDERQKKCGAAVGKMGKETLAGEEWRKNE